MIPNDVVNLSADKRRVFAEAARVFQPGGRLALAVTVTEREIATTTARQAGLCAAGIAGAKRTSRKYAAHSVSLLARKPASGSRPTNPTTTEEISK